MKGGRSNGFLIELSAPGLQCRGNTTRIHKRCAPPHWGLGSILGARRLTMQCFNHHAHPLMVGWRSVQTSKGACWKHSRCQSAQFACFGVANRVPKEIIRRGFLLPTYPSWPQRPAPRRPPASLDELAWSPCYVRLKHVRKTAFRLRPVAVAAGGSCGRWWLRPPWMLLTPRRTGRWSAKRSPSECRRSRRHSAPRDAAAAGDRARPSVVAASQYLVIICDLQSCRRVEI
jgi:hypothetical protein